MMENYWNLSIVLFSAHNQFIDSSDNNCSVEREINWATQRNRNLSKENHSTEELVFDLLFLLSLFVSTQRSHAYDATNNVFVCVYWWCCCLLHSVNLTIPFLPVKKRSWSERNPFLSYANKNFSGPIRMARCQWYYSDRMTIPVVIASIVLHTFRMIRDEILLRFVYPSGCNARDVRAVRVYAVFVRFSFIFKLAGKCSGLI